MFKEKRDRKPEYLKSREKIIARASAWNKENAEHRNALRRQNRKTIRDAKEQEKNHWEVRKQELIAEHGKDKGLKRLEYERHRPRYIAKSKEWAKANPEARREIARQYATKRRAADPEAARARDREAYKRNPRAGIERASVWISNNPKSQDWHIANKHKLIARSLARIAKQCGEIDASLCADCGSRLDIEMHHHDYNKPLDVTPLCRPCHRKRHA